jgi:hypothetical protein
MEGQPTTRCKFRVVGVTHGVPGSGTKVRLECHYPDEKLDGFKHGEDHAFFNATPFGHVEMQIQNPYGAELFQPGEFVYADFSPAPNPYKQPAAE